jgi:hypothetical protein
MPNMKLDAIRWKARQVPMKVMAAHRIAAAMTLDIGGLRTMT